MSQFTPWGFAALGVAGITGAALAKADEGNWGACKLCGCEKCNWDVGSFGGKLICIGLNNSCAFKRCCCGHHFTQHHHI